jgi:hypothetical protein
MYADPSIVFLYKNVPVQNFKLNIYNPSIVKHFFAVLWIRSRIRIRKDPELLPDPEPDP